MRNINIGKKILKKLNNNGYLAYFVGGVVRDIILEKEINDIDIATDATPDKIMDIFERTIPTGIKHGTITVIYDNTTIEVTTFRSEDKYDDFRHPNEVKFVSSIIEDLSRRDFTINAIAMDIDEQIIDPFEGRNAINNRLIKTVGNPNDRFLEDPLRMLRGIRFVAQLGFSIDALTWEKLKTNSSYIQYISSERIKIELDKIMQAEYADIAIDLLYKSELIYWIKDLDKTRLPYIDNEILSRLIKMSNDPVIRWFIFLQQIDDDERKLVMNSLKFSNNEKHELEMINSVYKIFINNISDLSIKQCLIESNFDITLKAIKILFIFNKISVSDKHVLIDKLKEINSQLKVRQISDLVIDGKDLIAAFNLPEGPWIKSLLSELFKYVVYEDIPNEKQILIELAFIIKGEPHDEG